MANVTPPPILDNIECAYIYHFNTLKRSAEDTQSIRFVDIAAYIHTFNIQNPTLFTECIYLIDGLQVNHAVKKQNEFLEQIKNKRK